MNDLTMGQWDQVLFYLFALGCPVFLGYLIAKHKLNRSRFLRFLGVLLIGTTCSLVPAGLLSVMFGFPAVLLASILVSCFLDKETQ